MLTLMMQGFQFSVQSYLLKMHASPHDSYRKSTKPECPTQEMPFGLSLTLSSGLKSPSKEQIIAFNSTLLFPDQGHNYLDWFISSSLHFVSDFTAGLEGYHSQFS